MNILFAYDGSDEADAAISAAAALLQPNGGKAVVLSVWEPLTVQALRAEKFGGPLAFPLRADELDADVIVLGARGLAGIAAFLGSVSNHVLQHAHRPVLIVPPKEARNG